MNRYIHENCGGIVTDPFDHPVCSECKQEGRTSIKAKIKAQEGHEYEVHFLTPHEIQEDDKLNETVKQTLKSAKESHKARKSKP